MLGLLCPVQLSAATQGTGAGHFAYLVETSGGITKIDLASGKVVYDLALPDSIIGSDNQAAREMAPEVEAAAVDAEGSGVIVALPDSGLNDEREFRQYRVLYLSLPGLRVISRFDIPQPQGYPPQLLIDPVRQRVLLNWQATQPADTTGWTYHISALGLPDLKEQRRWVARKDRNAEDLSPFPWFTHSSNQTVGSVLWIGPDASRLLSAKGNISFRGDSFSAAWEPSPPDTPARRSDAAKALGVSTGKGVLLDFAVDIQAGITLWSTTSDSGPSIQRLGVGPAGSGQIRSEWVSPWGKASLLGQGRTALLQVVEGPRRGSYTNLRMTGELIFYEVAGGKELGRMKVPQLAGSFQLTDGLCSTADEQYVLLRQPNGGLQLIEPATLRARTVKLENPVSIAAACFTADR